MVLRITPRRPRVPITGIHSAWTVSHGAGWSRVTRRENSCTELHGERERQATPRLGGNPQDASERFGFHQPRQVDFYRGEQGCDMNVMQLA